MFSRLSIVIPCYNESRFVTQVIRKVLDIQLEYPLTKEIIVVDDGSTDNSYQLLQVFAEKETHPIRVIRNEKNSGKGFSITKALEFVTGEIMIIQDADLEYDPADYNKLLKPIWEEHADVTYGSRFIGEGPHRVVFNFHRLGNKFLTGLSNLFTKINLTDMESGYKMFRTDAIRKITLKEKRFGFEPEVTAKISRIKGIRIYETGIAYYGRTYDEGKKINWKDGFRAIYCIIKYNVFSRK
jgi:glycosyltransferase involved in cell wall biosynthesis